MPSRAPDSASRRPRARLSARKGRTAAPGSSVTAPRACTFSHKPGTRMEDMPAHSTRRGVRAGAGGHHAREQGAPRHRRIAGRRPGRGTGRHRARYRRLHRWPLPHRGGRAGAAPGGPVRSATGLLRALAAVAPHRAGPGRRRDPRRHPGQRRRPGRDGPPLPPRRRRPALPVRPDRRPADRRTALLGRPRADVARRPAAPDLATRTRPHHLQRPPHGPTPRRRRPATGPARRAAHRPRGRHPPPRADRSGRRRLPRTSPRGRSGPRPGGPRHPRHHHRGPPARPRRRPAPRHPALAVPALARRPRLRGPLPHGPRQPHPRVLHRAPPTGPAADLPALPRHQRHQRPCPAERGTNRGPATHRRTTTRRGAYGTPLPTGAPGRRAHRVRDRARPRRTDHPPDPARLRSPGPRAVRSRRRTAEDHRPPRLPGRRHGAARRPVPGHRPHPAGQVLASGAPAFFADPAELAAGYPEAPQISGKQAWAFLP